MKLKFRDDKTGGDLLLFKSEEDFNRLYFGEDRFNNILPLRGTQGKRKL